MEREQKKEGGEDRRLNPEHPEISGFFLYINHSFFIPDTLLLLLLELKNCPLLNAEIKCKAQWGVCVSVCVY